MKRLICLLIIVVLFLGGICIYHSITPGTLPAVWSLKRADQSDVGHTVTLSFKTMVNNSELFVYTFDPRLDSGRLAVFSFVPDDISVCLLTVYEPEWSGIAELCKSLDSEFSATVISMTNVSVVEAQHLLSSTHYYSKEHVYQFDDSELLDIPNTTELDTGGDLQFYFGRLTDGLQTEEHWTAINDDLSVCIMGNSESDCSDQFGLVLKNFLKTVRRFWLQDELGL